MYDATNKTTKEMVEEICRQLNEHGSEDMNTYGSKHEFKESDGFGKKLQYVPRENLVKMLNCEVSDWSTLSSVIEAWGRAGALRFRPYMIDEEDNPSLVIRYNRYLHMFRGYHFQASGSPDGDGDYGSGSYRTDFLMHSEYWQSASRKSILAYMLWWAAMLDVGCRFDNFTKMFKENVESLEAFLEASMNYWQRHFDYKWSDVEKYITVDRSGINTVERKVYQLVNDNVVGAYVAIGKKTIQVQTAKGTWTLTIPDIIEGTRYRRDNEDDMEELEEEVAIFERNHFREMLAVMLLKLADIHISFINWYPLSGKKNFKYLKPINRPDVVSAKSLNEIYNAEPDEF